MKKYLMLMSFSSLLLCSCSVTPSKKQAETQLERIVQEELSEYQEKDSDYLDYEKQVNDNKLDQDGMYYDADMDTSIAPPNTIHVSFAQNSKLDFIYYYDKEHQQPISKDQVCYVTPGSTIYAVEPEIEYSGGNSDYTFSHFVLYSINQNGDIQEYQDWNNRFLL